MRTNKLWKRTIWPFVAMLVGGLIGGVITFAHVRAAPTAIPKVALQQPAMHSVKYVPGLCAVFTLWPKPDQAQNEPIRLLVGVVRRPFQLPGDDSVTERQDLCYMYLNEEDLTHFPSARKLGTRDDGIVCDLINTVDTVKGLDQLKHAFTKVRQRAPAKK